MKINIAADLIKSETGELVESDGENDVLEANYRKVYSGEVCSEKSQTKVLARDYFKFVFYCVLLMVPLYAITISIIKNDWVMMIIDALIVPIGFVHGLLLLFGYVS